MAKIRFMTLKRNNNFKKGFLFISSLFVVVLLRAQPINIMLVTGGHPYDTVQFFQMFDSMEGIVYEHFEQPQANELLVEGKADKFDVLVFYDMWETISDIEKAAYYDLTKKGKPFLFLHHTLASYKNWREFEQIIGGKYIWESPDIPAKEQSSYQHDVWVDIEIVDPNQPVTQGLQNFKLFDEVLGNCRVSNKVIPLLKTNHPKCTKIIGWENIFNSSRIIYIQQGHGFHAFESEDYRKLIAQAIKYLAD